MSRTTPMTSIVWPLNVSRFPNALPSGHMIRASVWLRMATFGDRSSSCSENWRPASNGMFIASK